MHLVHRYSYCYRSTLILGLLCLITTFLFNTLVNGQKRSREEASKEAARIATEAERKMGEAHKNGDRKLIVEAERAATESFVKAIELWREAGNDQRLIAAVGELTRLYSVHGDYERVVDRLGSEANYWQGRGDLSKQIDTLFTLGVRQWQMKREAAATETLEWVVEMSRSTRHYSLERNALEQLAMLYDKSGRAKDAASSRARAKELWAIREPPPASVASPFEPPKIPDQWVDLPLAPLAAEYRMVDGVNQAVLVNRSLKGITMVMFGCVLEDNNKTRVLHGLVGVGTTHGGVRPGFHYGPFATLNGPLNRWTDEKMGCEGAAKMAVIEAGFDDGTGWKADGSDWVIR
jgi:hypothetical protein